MKCISIDDLRRAIGLVRWEIRDRYPPAQDPEGALLSLLGWLTEGPDERGDSETADALRALGDEFDDLIEDPFDEEEKP